MALVGYTNAGKSTPVQPADGRRVLAKDMLFATLDPTMRGMKLPCGREVILSDTVGFISDLPTHLVEAFRATLEEVQQADVILHVRDMSHPETRTQRDAVMEILADLGIGMDDERLIEVLNKIDKLPEEKRKHLRRLRRARDPDENRARPSRRRIAAGGAWRAGRHFGIDGRGDTPIAAAARPALARSINRL